MSCSSVVLVGACLHVVLGTRRLRVFSTYSCPFCVSNNQNDQRSTCTRPFCRVLRNGRHSQPWGTPRGGSECQTDTIQDSFAALLPLLYRGRCRSIAMVRRSFNIETLFVSWTIFSAHTDTPLTTVLLYYATAPRRTVGTPPALSATPVDRCARPAGISRISGRSSLASIAKGRCPSLACLASACMAGGSLSCRHFITSC